MSSTIAAPADPADETHRFAGVVDVVGAHCTYVDPLWRVVVELSALERDLLRCWQVRRLAFVAHAGAPAMYVTQSYSRLEHSLGVLALTAHFAPDDRLARVAALLHDVGHLPLSHTLEGQHGLDHHHLGRQRVLEVAPLLHQHGISAEQVLEVLDGDRPSVLRPGVGAMGLDHLDSFVRSGRCHARTASPPPQLLARLGLVDGAVCTDEATVAELVDLVVAEARWQASEMNVVATAVTRQLCKGLLGEEEQRVLVQEMTDDELWGRLLAEPATAALARELRVGPAGWVVRAAGEQMVVRSGEVLHRLPRRYLSMPLVDGRVVEASTDVLGLAGAPGAFLVIRRA